MNWNPSGPSDNQSRETTAQYGFFDLLKKPVEIYVFVDPLCPECWSLEPILKKLAIEYGRFLQSDRFLTGDSPE